MDKIKIFNNFTFKIIYSNRNKIALLLLILLLLCPIYLYADYNYIAKQEIEQYLDQKRESILLESVNDTEKTQKIIEWERNEFIAASKPFSSGYEYPLRFPKDAKWYIYLKKGSCGERALIFEDMANRTNLTYRKIIIDGYINPRSNSSNNHRWSEVLLEDGNWAIADSGFRLYPSGKNQSYFTSKWGALIGHVAVDNNGSFVDCTDSYVNQTGKLVIRALRDGEPIDGANVSIKLNYNETSCHVVGREIKYSTNDSGIHELNLGVYDNTNYTVTVDDLKSIYKYSGQKDITIKNGTNYLEIELSDFKWRYLILAIYIGILIIVVLYGYIFYKIGRKIRNNKAKKYD